MDRNTKNDNRFVLIKLRDELKGKFPWLSLGYVVYNNVYGYQNHEVGGSAYVHLFHYAGKNAIIFVRKWYYNPILELIFD